MTRALIIAVNDCTHYLAATTEVDAGESGDRQLVRDGAGQFKRFPSVYAAKRYWFEAGYRQAWLVSHSPYDEMIGGGEPAEDEMPLAIAPEFGDPAP